MGYCLQSISPGLRVLIESVARCGQDLDGHSRESVPGARHHQEPTALLAFIVARGWKRLEKWPWRTSIQQGLAPVSIGLLLAGCFTMAKGAISGVETAAIAVGVLLILLQYKINPALLAGAVLGVLSFMPK